MALTLRLQRHGSTHNPFYHIIACDSRMARDSGNYIEKLGYYDPSKTPSLVTLKEDRVRFWFDRGAVLSNTVKNILKNQKFEMTRGTAKKKAVKKDKPAKAAAPKKTTKK